MHGFLTSHTEVKAGCVFHLISVSCFLYPVTNGVAVHPVHNVSVIIRTVPVMAWAATWWQRRQPFCRLVTKTQSVNLLGHKVLISINLLIIQSIYIDICVYFIVLALLLLDFVYMFLCFQVHCQFLRCCKHRLFAAFWVIIIVIIYDISKMMLGIVFCLVCLYDFIWGTK